MIRVRSVMTGVPGAPYYTNLYFEGTSAIQAAQAVQDVVDFWDLIQDVTYSAATVLIEDEAAIIDAATGDITAMITTGTGQSLNGGAVGQLLPTAVAACIRYRTGVYLGGRQVQGRSFIGGMTEENSTTLGQPSTALVGELTNAAAVCLVDGPSQLVVWSRKGATEVPVQSVSCWEKWGSIRSHRD